MKIHFNETSVQSCVAQPRFTRVMKGMSGILMALLFQGLGEVGAQIVQGTYHVKLSWNASISPDVTGYRIHYGIAGGVYTSNIVLGNVTSGKISGLADGVTYHIAVSAFNAAGVESGFSNEVSFKPGLHKSGIRIAEGGESVLIVQGLIGRQYDIEASEDLNTWTLIDSVTIPDGGSLEFSDPDAPLFSRRFYRTRVKP